ncbi:MAG: helix-turn-helix transcriptional regulator [Clostridia bacterium]|nr:helix-turn-helix transcriptional regulator [Clostridia bacterium]
MCIEETIGTNIRHRRKELHFAQEDFAYEIGLSPYYYGRIERGKANPTIQVLTTIANGLGVKISELIDEGYGNSAY